MLNALTPCATLELELDKCSRAYGVLPCRATLVDVIDWADILTRAQGDSNFAQGAGNAYYNVSSGELRLQWGGWYSLTSWSEVATFSDAVSDGFAAGTAHYENKSAGNTIAAYSFCFGATAGFNQRQNGTLSDGATYRLTYTPGGSATQGAVSIIGTALWVGDHGVLSCWAIGAGATRALKRADAVGRFGNGAGAGSGLSPPSFRGGSWKLERQNKVRLLRSGGGLPDVAVEGNIVQDNVISGSGANIVRGIVINSTAAMAAFAAGAPSPVNAAAPAFTWSLQHNPTPRAKTGDHRCFNTFATCQDKSNYALAAGGRAYKFCTKGVLLDDYESTITGHQHRPAAIKEDYGLWAREKITITMDDFVAPDSALDDEYLSQRAAGDIAATATWGRRWLARNQYFNRRRAVFKVGYVNAAGAFVATSTHNLRIDEVGLSRRGDKITITLRDGIKVKEEDGAVCPKPSDMRLALNLAATANTFTIIGADVATIKSGDLINIGSEVVVVNNKINNVVAIPAGSSQYNITRAQHGTGASSHEAGDSVQVCYAPQGVNAADIISDLLTNYADIGGATINTDEFTDIKNGYLSAFALSAVIPKPIGVDKLMEEIQRSVLANVWHDSQTDKMRIKSIIGINVGSGDQVPLGDDDIIGGSIAMAEQPRKSISRSLVFNGLRVATKYGKDAEDWRRVAVVVDSESESQFARGEEYQATLYTRWLSATQAGLMSERIVRQGQVNGGQLVFTLPLGTGALPIAVGEVYEYRGRMAQDVFGGDDLYAFRVMEVAIVDYKTARITAQRSGYGVSNVLAFVLDASLLDGEHIIL